MKVFLTLCFNVICLAVFCQHSRIFPNPSSISGQSGFFSPSEITVSTEDFKSVAPLNNRFEHMTGRKLTADENPNLKHVINYGLPPEAYYLKVSQQEIEIQSSDIAGFFYGIESLIWLYDQDAKGFACADIQDNPRFSWRGVHLDCSRHFFSVEEIKTFLDDIALFKINRFHWHLTDDQGWRIEIKRYPKLTETGGWRDQTLIGHFSKEPAQYDGKRYGGFYTQEEVKDVIDYAQRLQIEIIPEIEMPGHALAALTAYPELGCTGGPYRVAQTWGVFDDIFCSKASTRDFLKNVLDEVCALFPGEVIHIGGDEAPKKRWNNCPHCAQVMQENNLKDAHELQSFFVKDMVQYLKSKGKRLMGWDEILEGGLPEGAEVMSWRGTEGGIAAAKAGHKVVMTPTAYCYFDYYQSASPYEPLCIGGYLPIEKVYNYDPISPALLTNGKEYVLGVQANIWTEYLPDMERVYQQLLPRLFALSEVAWSEHQLPYPEFRDGFSSLGLSKLDQLGIPYSTAYMYPVMRETSTGNGMEYEFVSSAQNITYASNRGKANLSLKASKGVENIQRQIYIKKDEITVDSIPFNLMNHRLLGSKVHFETPPSEKYNENQDVALTDGIVGQVPWKGNQWLGFDTSRIVFSFAVPHKVVASQFNIGFLHDPGSWIYQPQRIVIERKNGKKYDILGEFAVKNSKFSIPVKIKEGEYRITVINYGLIPEGNPGEGFTPWTFIDEFFIR